MSGLTVIIPVYRPNKQQFDELIDKIYSQTVVPDRIILLWTVPEGADEDRIKKKSRQYSNDNTDIVYIKQSEFDHGGTRKYGMSLVETEYALCMTQDAIPADDRLFEELIKAIKRHGSSDNNSIVGHNNDNGKKHVHDEGQEKQGITAAVYARQLPGKNATETEKITRYFNYPDTERIQNKSTLKKYGIKTYFCSDVCAMYRLDKYREAGEFVDKTIFNEDMLMAAALINCGYTVRYVPSARVIHSHHYSYRQQYKRNFDNAVSHRQYSEVFDSVPAEGEGIRLVLTTMKKLVKKGKIYLIPDLIIQSAYKYMGYRSGMRYDKLSKKAILKKTMNKGYWT